MDQEEQVANKPERDKLGRLLPGNTANPNGRPPGQSLKEFWKFKLNGMTEEEKLEFSKDLSPDTIYKMAEGNPHQSSDEKIEVTIPKPILGGITKD